MDKGSEKVAGIKETLLFPWQEYWNGKVDIF